MSDETDEQILQDTPEEKWAAALREHIGVQKPYCIIRRSDKEMLAPKSFEMGYNRVVNGVEGLGVGKGARYKDAAAKAAITSPKFNVVQSICYRPDGPPIIDRIRFNMWTDPGIEPIADDDPKIFLEHINYLIPNKAERILLLSWLAWIVQHPDQKVQYAILIVGRGGTGKSWLGMVMERLFGADNVVLISEEDVVTSTFNGFSENKRLVFLHETPAKQMADLIDKVKGLITEDHTWINRKGIERYKAENFANLMAVCNDDVKIDLANRRWAVIRAADDMVGYNEKAAFQAYYSRLWSVVPKGIITDELRRILHYLRTFDLKGAKFDPMVAPITGAKEEAADSGDNLHAKVAQAYKDRTGPFGFNLLTAEDVAKHVGGAYEGRTLTDCMGDVGCRKLRGPKGRDVQISIDGKRPRLWAISPAVAQHHVTTGLAELTRLYKEERDGKPKDEPLRPDDSDFLGDFEPGDGDGLTLH